MDPRVLRAVADDWPQAAAVRTFPVTNPAAGTDWSFTVPGESCLGVFSITAQFVASAAVANRVATLRVTDGSSTLWRVGAGAAVTAGLTTVFSWVPELAYRDAAIIGASLVVGLPPLYLASGQVVAVTTTAIDVGDQWSAVNIVALETFHGHIAHERAVADQIRNEADAIAGVLGGTL